MPNDRTHPIRHFLDTVASGNTPPLSAYRWLTDSGVSEHQVARIRRAVPDIIATRTAGHHSDARDKAEHLAVEVIEATPEFEHSDPADPAQLADDLYGH